MSEGLVEWLSRQLDLDEREIAKHPDDAGDEPDICATRETGYPCLEILTIGKKRALAEVAAKRKILDDFDRCWRTLNAYAADEIREVYYDQIFPALALPYADRPGYQESWRPT